MYLKSLRIFPVIALLFFAATTANAQHTGHREGSTAVLKGITRMNVRFRYEGMTITHKHIPEADFVQDNVDRLNDKKPGKGLDWKHAWLKDREEKFEPQFNAAFDAASGIQLGHYPEASYTLIFHTTHMETGHNIRISRKSSYIDGEALIVETDHPDHVVFKVKITDCKGKSFDGYDFAANLRLMESYAAAGRAVGGLMRQE